MTAHRAPRLNEHFIDSGPLLCLGTSATLADLYDSLFRAKMKVVEAVDLEINRKADEVLRPGGRKSGGYEKRAAKSARYRYAEELRDALPRPDPVPTQLAAWEAEERRDRDHPLKHRGECESIHAARAASIDFLTNDGGAARLASRSGVKSATFVDIMRQALGIDRRADRDEIARELITAKRSGVDTGENIRSALDL